MNDRSRPVDPRKIEPKYMSEFDTMHSQEVACVIRNIKKTVVKQHAAPQHYTQYREEIPEREREIRMAIEMRFKRSKMNSEYVYRREDSNPISSRGNRKGYSESTHSSQMEEYQHLKQLHYVNLNDQNQDRRRTKPTLDKYQSLKNGMKRFKIGNNNSHVRKTEGDEQEPTRIRSNGKPNSKNDSPLGFQSRYLFKPSKNKTGNKRKVNLSDQSGKYRTLTTPYLEKSKEFVRYGQAQKMAKSKEQLSRDSSSSQKSRLLQSNLTLQVDFKNKQNGNSSSMHYKNISSSTRLGNVPKMVSQERSKSKGVSTSSGKLQKTNQRLLKVLLFDQKRI